MSKKLRDEAEFLKWAELATRGLDQSNVMFGVLNGEGTKGARHEFALQIGHCLLEGKPILLLVPRGANLPPKLEAAATVIEYFDPALPASAEQASKRALERLGVFKKH
jgi:hypothetical protein